jgi:hypothetical protein
MDNRRRGARLSEQLSPEKVAELHALVDPKSVTSNPKLSLNEKLTILCDHKQIKKYQLGGRIAHLLKNTGPEQVQVYMRQQDGRAMYGYCNDVFKHARSVMKAIPQFSVDKAIETGVAYVQNTSVKECALTNAIFGYGK